jgi:hypothetical protein
VKRWFFWASVRPFAGRFGEHHVVAISAPFRPGTGLQKGHALPLRPPARRV